MGSETSTAEQTSESMSVLNSGPLASPLVRIVLAVYLLAILGVAFWLSQDNVENAYNAQEVAIFKTQYQIWAGETYEDDMVAAKLDLIDKRMATLQVLLLQGDRRAARVICRELMAVDGLIESPLYQYATKCLSRL